MSTLQLQPKVQQLEQLKIDFDDFQGDALPKVINSKKKFDNGPTNNKRIYSKKNIKQAFGFVKEDSAGEDQPDGDDDLG